MKAVVKVRDYLWRPLTDSEADTDLVIALRNDERFGRWFYHRVTRESHKRFLQGAEARDEINWVIERNGEPIAVSSIYHVDWANRKAEVGRIASIDPRMFHLNWIVSAVMADVMGLNKLYIETLETNTIIARGVERMGMVREGMLRHHVACDGKFVNVLLYSNIRPEWEQMKAASFEKFGLPEVLSYEGKRVDPIGAQRVSLDRREKVL
jgi:RimJ/RimL family protein N-acetyltransferase